MDSSALSRMSFDGIWWLFIWAFIGMLSTCFGIGWLLLHLFHHIYWK